jgi:hypothetical protein
MENKKAAWPKFGEWVYNAQGEPHCSECGAEVKDITPFCAHCGACMGDIDEFGGNDPWFRVERESPKIGQRVIATDGVFVGEVYYTHAGTYSRLGKRTTHWMPLPDVPQR